MKNYSIRLLIILFSVFGYCNAQSQDNPSIQKLPVDSKIKIGKLGNGFTYYIRPNQKPEKRVEMRLAVNAGSILEDDHQLGLAHFVEHMCFNGTLNFKKNELVEYLQSIGIRFGADLNAYTSFDETVYMLTIPSDSTELLKKGFQVMEDWAHQVTFDSSEIDKERGVIIEEWRLGRGPWQRMRDKYLPVLFKDSRYADRLPIGKKEILESFPYDTLRKFYHDWYRTDLMALVVVGDIDPAFAEAQIKEHFSEINVAENPIERTEYQVPDQPVTMVNISTDAEAPLSLIQIFYKTDVKKYITYEDYLDNLKYSFLTGMLNQRLAELTEKENPPFVNAGYQYGGLWARNKSGLQGSCIVGGQGIERGLETLLIENKRISKFGFTQGEFNRFKLDLLKRYENAYNERDKTESEQFADEYVRNYLESEPIPGIEFEYQYVKDNIDKIKLEDINKTCQSLIVDANRVLIVNAPEKEGLIVPTENRVLAIAQSIDTMNIQPYKDTFAQSNLLNKSIKKGKIVSENRLDELDATDIKLSNGARVILKSTNYKNDEVMLTAFSMGGHSVYPDADHFTALNADAIIQESGVNGYSNSDLDKILAGKTVSVSPSIGYETETMSANCRVSDMESMFQLMYLYFTDPRADQGAFNSYISKKKDLYENLIKEPQYYFYDQYYRIKAQNHVRGDYIPKPEEWNNVNFKRAIDIYKDRFADANNFTFIMVGAFNIDSVKPLIAQYIGGLPTMKRSENYVDLGIRPPKGKNINNIYKGNDPKSLAIIYYEKELPWNERDAFMATALSDILGFRYIEKLREEMSGVYTSRVRASLSKIPYSKFSIQITIPCSPDNVDSLISAAIGEIKQIQEKGVEEKEIIKARETKKRELEKAKKTNEYWLSAIQSALINGTDLTKVTKEEYIDQITSEEMQRIAKEYVNIDDYLRVVLYPESYKK
jgi:zinc protease